MDFQAGYRLIRRFLPLTILLVGALRRVPSGRFKEPSSIQCWSYWDLIFVMSLLTAIGLLPLPDMLVGQSRGVRVLLMLVPVLIPVAAILAILRWKYGLPIAALGFRRRHAAYYTVWATSIVLGIVCVSSAVGGLSTWRESSPEVLGASELWGRIGDAVRHDPSGLLISVFATSYITVIGPIFEEILFRGFSTRPASGGRTGAAFMTTAVWSLEHGYGAINMLKLSVLGLVLARVYRRTESLLPGIALHVTLNVAATIVEWAGGLGIVANIFPFLSLGALTLLAPCVIILFKLAPTEPDERRVFLGAAPVDRSWQ
jgi:membrane protease YdiL (CAAX protease family)